MRFGKFFVDCTCTGFDDDVELDAECSSDGNVGDEFELEDTLLEESSAEAPRSETVLEFGGLSSIKFCCVFFFNLSDIGLVRARFGKFVVDCTCTGFDDDVELDAECASDVSVGDEFKLEDTLLEESSAEAPRSETVLEFGGLSSIKFCCVFFFNLSDIGLVRARFGKFVVDCTCTGFDDDVELDAECASDVSVGDEFELEDTLLEELSAEAPRSETVLESGGLSTVKFGGEHFDIFEEVFLDFFLFSFSKIALTCKSPKRPPVGSAFDDRPDSRGRRRSRFSAVLSIAKISSTSSTDIFGANSVVKPTQSLVIFVLFILYHKQSITH